MTVSDILKKALELTGSDSPRLDVEVLLTHVLQKDRSFCFSHPEYELSDTQAPIVEALLERRKQGEPIAHLIGEKEFWSLPFSVDQSTLIPRPETELLVELALEYLFEQDHTATCLDLGTGTGAVAMALAHSQPKKQFVAVDKYDGALTLARHNAETLKLNNIDIVQSDWFSALKSHRPFNVIVSNPPYIDPSDPHLKQGDVFYEPSTALVAADEGLADIKHIIQESPQHLVANGVLLLEHGFQQAKEVRAAFHQKGFASIETKKDLAGLDRVTLGVWAR